MRQVERCHYDVNTFQQTKNVLSTNIYVCCNQIAKHLQVSVTGSDIIKDLKGHLDDIMKRNFPINEKQLQSYRLLDSKFNSIATKVFLI